MWWREARASCGRLARVGRVAIALASAGLAGGCFQPLYGANTAAGSSSVRDALSAIEVQPVDVMAEAIAGPSDASLAVQMRNDLIFSFTGGGAPSAPAYRLKVRDGGIRD